MSYGAPPKDYDMIFVFGSNEAGRHGAGAARDAADYHGAEYGVGNGPMGRCYAIPTKDHDVETLPLPRIRRYVNQFMTYARKNPDKKFQLTAIGCGLAGYRVEQIAPLFADLPGRDPVTNVLLPPEFRKFFRDLPDERFWK